MGFILIIQIFIISWLIRSFKSALFWVYLWQLKEYHIGRFADHFRTHKGKKAILNTLVIVKIVLLLSLAQNNKLFYFTFVILFFIYLAELLIFVKNVFTRSLKFPKFTPKTILITGISFALIITFLFWVAQVHIQYAHWWQFIAYLLLFDVLTPLIISIIVLLIQPFFVLARNRILKKAAKKMAQFPKLKVIGITGSYGKTSTKEFLTAILSSKFKVLATPEHKNSEMGIAQTILHDLKPEHEIFIVEMGSYNKGGIKLLCDMVKPHLGMVTGVNQQHLATFGSLENLLSAEGGEELALSLPKDGVIVLNGNNKYCLDLYKKMYRLVGPNLEKKIYTLQKNNVDCDIWTEDIAVNRESLSFIAQTRQKELAHVNVNVLGKQNVQNLLGAMLVAKEFGMNLGEINQACKNIKAEQAGMTLKRGIHGINVIDSSYSSNPDGVVADLDYLGIFKGKKVVVMPCLIELGQKSIEAHIQIGKKIAETCDLAIITTKDKFKEIKIGAGINGMKESKILLCDKPHEILHHITTQFKEGDAVLLEGRVPKELITLLNGK